jgi:hypothetical protein
MVPILVIPDLHCLDILLRLHCRVLRRECGHHLWRHNAANGIQRHPIHLELNIAQIGYAPHPTRLKHYLHQQRPTSGVVRRPC